MSEFRTFDELIGRLRAGDNDAATTVFRRSERRLLALARKHLHRRFRSKVDPEDVVQSVYLSFFTRCASGKFHLDSWDSLWAMLALITVRKCRNRIEYFRAARRDVCREDPTLPPSSELEIDTRCARLIHSPSHGLVLAEALEQLTRGVDERQRAVIALTLQGYSVSDISARLGRPKRSVRREVERMHARLAQLNQGRARTDPQPLRPTRKLHRPGMRHALCRCGHRLTFWLTPWGYKNNCPNCGAMVELQPLDIPSNLALQADHATVTCDCGTRMILISSDGNRTKTCPACRRPFAVPQVRFGAIRPAPKRRS